MPQHPADRRQPMKPREIALALVVSLICIVVAYELLNVMGAVVAVVGCIVGFYLMSKADN